ncbi:MAG: tetratricopeptide repeat protein [Dokdonella sp.]
MNESVVERLRAQLGGPRDGALLRFSLANALIAAGDFDAACVALRDTLAFDPDYSAAWKALGTTLQKIGDPAGAAASWRKGIAVATARGDKQAEKEMQVFLRRVEKVL